MDEEIASLDTFVPPNNNLAEAVTVGAMLLSPAIADAITEIVTPADFYKPAHAAIYAAIVKLAAAGQPADAATVAAELAHAGDLQRVGGVPYLHTLIESVPTVANGPHYAREVASLAIRRRIGEAGVKASSLARGPGEIDEIRESAQQAIYEATTTAEERAPIQSVGDLAGPALEHIRAITDGEVTPGIPTGLRDLDRMFGGGLRPGQLIIPAGRTSMGKSVVTQNWLAHCAAETMRPTVLFSLEMSVDEMMTRLLSEISRVPLHVLISGQVRDEDWYRLREAEQRILTWPLFMVDKVRTAPAMRAYLRRFHARMGDLAMVGVDYLQRVQWHGHPRVDRHVQVGRIADAFKDMAQDLGVPVIAPCQLNRGPETRPGKNANVPRLSDLRESGDLEQTADVVVLLHRPAYYDKQSPRAGEADFIVAKNRNGPTDTVTVTEQLHIQRFVDMAWATPTAAD
jgi:replicative DNA helicase